MAIRRSELVNNALRVVDFFKGFPSVFSTVVRPYALNLCVKLGLNEGEEIDVFLKEI